MFNKYQATTDQIKVVEHEIDITDQFTTDCFDSVNAEVDRLSRIGDDYYSEGDNPIDRKRTSKIDMNNPATREMLDTYPSFNQWLAMVPTAAALEPLYDPNCPRLADGTLIDTPSSEWFKNIADARGMRSRAEVMKGILKDEAVSAVAPQRWISLACGAAQPVFSVLESLREEGILLPSVTLADLDKNALSLTERYAQEHSMGEHITTKRLNILQRGGLTYERQTGAAGVARSALLRLRGRLPAESFDAVDAVGILEYLKRPDWKFNYKNVVTTTKKMAGAETFLRNAYDLVKPGGILVVGNMLDTHPQLGFTLNVIQWPHIQPRSVEEMTNIIKTVGINGQVDVYKPSDGVYAIYGIRKP
ncbi:MAG: hypothetical protein ABIR91_05805 [Candidatus Saccharimonadales bacterium]